MNVLSAENGGHVVVATNDQWSYAIDGDEKNWQYIDIGVVGSWAVYGFKNDKPATFDTFKVLILGTESWNLKEFELLAGNDSATGKFESIGKFQTQNIRFFKEPYQEFKFPPVKARYLKVRSYLLTALVLWVSMNSNCSVRSNRCGAIATVLRVD